MTKLKPCPFCGGKAIKKNYSNDGFVITFIFCSNCPAQTRPYLSEETAIEEWNRRDDDGR